MAGPGWADIADWYDGVVRSGRTPHGLATRTLLELAGDVTGRRVLDVACGQGIATRALAQTGAASVTGGRRRSPPGSTPSGAWSSSRRTSPRR
jgi:hypothetical protein